MFAYCNNNPVYLVDKDGDIPEESVDIDGDGNTDYYVYRYTFTKRFLGFPVERTGNVYIYTCFSSGSELANVAKPKDFKSSRDLLTAYYIETDYDNPVIYAQQAQKVKKQYRASIIECFQRFDQDFNTPWDRTNESLLVEWQGHHKYRIAKSAQNIDFDNREEGKPADYYDQKAFNRIMDRIRNIFTS